MRITLTVLLACLLIPAVSAQEDEGEKLFRDMEKKIRTAKGFQVTSTYQLGNRKAKAELLMTNDNKVLLKVAGHIEGDRKGAFELVSDGKRLKSKGARLHVMPSGLPAVEAGGQSEWPTPRNFHEVFSTIAIRGGMWYTVLVLPYIASKGFGARFDADGEGSKVRVYNFKLAGAEKVGDQDAKVIKYRFGDGTSGPDNAEITLWIDSKSPAPLKRTFFMKNDNLKVTETYSDYQLEPKVDAKTFELVK